MKLALENSDYIDLYVKKYGKNALDTMVNKTMGAIQKATVEAVLLELKRNNLLKSTDQTTFKKTETLLFNYPKFLVAIERKFEEIKTINECGTQKRSGSVTNFTGTCNYDRRSEAEKADDQIVKIHNAIFDIESHIRTIDRALNSIENDPYYDLIRMIYFEGKTREVVAEYFYVDVSTVSRNKNRLINILKILLFTEDAAFEMMYS